MKKILKLYYYLMILICRNKGLDFKFFVFKDLFRFCNFKNSLSKFVDLKRV